MSECCDASTGCITCGDVAIEMSVLTVDEQRGLADCEDADGARELVQIELAMPVSVGDRLLVHAGTAIGHAAEVAR